MAHVFNVIPAKPTFGTLRENLYQSDYINRKKRGLAYCNSSSRYNSYHFKLGCKRRIAFPVNKSNLIIGQYSKENLKDVCTVTSFAKVPVYCDCSSNEIACIPVMINPTVTFYENYVIDPLGELFGNSQCGELNYVSMFLVAL